jgi:WD40-like Beta Propeller Repeat
VSLFALMMCLLPATQVLPGRADRFQTPNNGPDLGVWRITNDPTVRDWANYHNTQCWSPDGRYICYTRYGTRLDRNRYREHNTVYIHDLAKNETRLVGQGHSPRWAHRHNWLFYVHEDPAGGPTYEQGAEVRWLDVGTGVQTRVCYGIEQLGETDFQDRWLYGAARFRGRQPEFRVHRIPVSQDAKPEPLPDVAGAQLLPSPGHPVFFTRQDHREEPFNATRWWFDLEGKNRHVFAPTIQQCHMSWLGNGDYLLLGNGLIRGRRWDEPFPSNLHVLASIAVGDVSPCGRSGRYACGDSHVADLRSGDGWFFIDPLSIICFPKSIADNSGIYDADPKGSPDGTKVCFVSNYDLKDGPLTHISQNMPRQADSLPVVSTAGFPESGAIVVQREVIGYKRKTADSFEGLMRCCTTHWRRT